MDIENVRTDYYLQDSEEVNFSESVNFSYENFNDRYQKAKTWFRLLLSDELTLNWEFGIDSNLKDESGISRFTAQSSINLIQLKLMMMIIMIPRGFLN